MIGWFLTWWHERQGHTVQVVPDLLGTRRVHYYCECGKEWVR